MPEIALFETYCALIAKTERISQIFIKLKNNIDDTTGIKIAPILSVKTVGGGEKTGHIAKVAIRKVVSVNVPPKLYFSIVCY